MPENESRCLNPECNKITRSHDCGFGFFMCHTCWTTLPEEKRKELIKKAKVMPIPTMPTFDMKKITEMLEKQGLQIMEGDFENKA